jgi:2-C-methyl-D-erythritol 4-phosphate cytidylyltransferase / 2-C-methyl-D-erythritol 2,4-cyclodiphosphate synthase
VSNSKETAVVIVAAGRGERAGQEGGPKQFRLIGGKPVIRHTVAALHASGLIGRIVVVVHKDDHEIAADSLAGIDAEVLLVTGGATRQASTLLGMKALARSAPAYVMVHDAVRPFVRAELLARVINALDDVHGVIPALAVSDTLKTAQDGIIGGTVDRQRLFAAQTPQAFPFEPIFKAHLDAAEQSLDNFTDDAAIAEWAGMPARIVEGSPDNFKLTWKRDIELADQRLSSFAQFPDVRTGNGYDVHAFEPGDQVTLCGVVIPHEAKLNGHSDADVALHALTDALLATRGAGDIGTHFPPSDPKWRGAASSIFLKHAAGIVRSAGGRIANADITLICEAPKIGPHREAMVAAVSAMLALDPERISVKATTNEKLGFIGRKEGIAAIATATVVYPGQLK